MKRSVERISSEKSGSEAGNQFSFKRYFINNVDSYHGQYILKQIVKLINDKSAVLSSKETSRTTVLGEDADVLPPSLPEPPYEIFATVSDHKVKSIDNVARILHKTECLPVMLTCGTVILDVSCDKDELKIASTYIKLLNKLLERETPALVPSDAGDTAGQENKRYFILISSVLTWALTRPIDPDTPDMAFIETDFRKRRPHPNYKTHYEVENEVIGIARKYKSLIGALVIGSGLTYGGREDVLFFWFQKAWECEKLLPIFGRGGNAVPIINIEDLAQIIYNLLSDFPKKLYILAVEQNVTKQREIIKSIGNTVGSGMFKCIPPEDAFLIPEIDQRIFDLMTLDVNMEPTFIVETMGLQWVSELIFGENVPHLIKEFKKERGLKPFKVVVYGPPMAGKTVLSQMICDNYGLTYVSVDTVAQDIMNDLAWRISHWAVGETTALEMPAEDEDAAAQSEDDLVTDEETQETARQTLALLQSGKPLSEEEILGYLRQRLLSKECKNRGWVLDGFPTNLNQCAALFEKGDQEDSGDEEEDKEDDQFEEDAELFSNVLKNMLPDVVASLEATDEFLCEKAMRQPESDSRLDEEMILRRLSEFRSTDGPEVTPLNFFDELDIHPLVVPVKDHQDYSMKGSYSAVALRMGRPCRYGKLMALIEASEKKEKQEIETLRAKEAKALKEFETKMQQDREDKMEYWSELYAIMRDEEEAALAVAGEPMRNYLVQNIFPTLTQALLEVAKLRPNDPIDFLAEYLFKQNPSGKMLEPGYNLQAEKLLGKIKIVDDALKDLDINIDPLIPPEAEVTTTSKKTVNPMSAL